MTSVPWAADCNQILYNLLKANAYQNSVHALALSNVSVSLDEYNLKAVTLHQENDPDWGAAGYTDNILNIYRTTWEKCLLPFLCQVLSLCAGYFTTVKLFLNLTSDVLTCFKIPVFYRPIDPLFHSPLRLAPDPFLFCLSQSLAAFNTCITS